MLPHVVYLMNTEYPNLKAHSLQVTKMLFSLAKHTKVTFVCNGFTVPESKLIDEIYKQYGIDLSTVHFLAIPKKKLTGISFYFTLNGLRKSIGKNAVFYTRSYNLAKRLARSKFIHHSTVILETHKKSGYYKEDMVADSPYLEQRRHIEKDNKSIRLLKKIYKSVDGLVFTSSESLKIVTADLGLKQTAYVWHPLIPKPCTETPRKGIVYCGSLGPNKLIELLLHALALAPSNHVIDLLGGSAEDVRRIRGEAEKLGVSGNIRFLNRVPPRELPGILCRYAFGLSLMEGLKVADYVESGLIPVIPRIPMYEAIFDVRNAIFFEPDSADSLRHSLDSLDGLKTSEIDNHNLLETYSTDSTARKIFELIAACSGSQQKKQATTYT